MADVNELAGAADAANPVAGRGAGYGDCAGLYGTGLADPAVGRGRAWLEIDLAAIAANIAAIKRAIGPRRFMGVIKANAYGHGMVPIARAAVRAGADALGVATPEEALAVRAAGVTAPVLLMGHSHPDHAAALVAADVTVAVYTVEVARALAAVAAAQGRTARVHVKVDTGLMRVGVAPAEAVSFVGALRELGSLAVEGVFTHFSGADDGDVARTREELGLLQDVLDGLAAAGHEFKTRHAAATAATLESPETWLDMVRVGIGMYGYYPFPGCRQTVEFRPAMAFKTRITRLRRVPAGTRVGYSGSYTTPRATTIATIPVGYADGLDKHLGNKGSVLVRGRRVPRAGTIAMDLSMIDVGALDCVAVDDEVVLVGAQGDDLITLEEMAATAGTAVEHLLTLLSGRPSRVYVGADGGG